MSIQVEKSWRYFQRTRSKYTIYVIKMIYTTSKVSDTYKLYKLYSPDSCALILERRKEPFQKSRPY